MSIIGQIVADINSTLKTCLENAYGCGRIFAIAERVVKKDMETTQIYPAIVDLKGNAEKIFIEDKEGYLLYHRVTSVGQSNSIDEGFGDGIRRNFTYNNLLIFHAEKTILQKEKEDLIEFVATHFPLEVSKTLRSTLSIEKALITPGNITSDKLTVYKQESGEIDELLKPSTIMFAFPYTVQIVKNCKSNC